MSAANRSFSHEVYFPRGSVAQAMCGFGVWVGVRGGGGGGGRGGGVL